MSVQRDYWVPKGRIHNYSRIPQPGDTIAIDHDDLRHKPWLLADIRTHNDRVTLTLRTPGSPDLAASDKHHISVPKLPNPHIYILAGRYPLCSCCGDLMPCQQERAEDITEAAMRRAERYETPGICPACTQPVTARQASMTITTNLYVPLGPPVTFHQRKTCKQSLIDYEAKVATAEGRPAVTEIEEFRRGWLNDPADLRPHETRLRELATTIARPFPIVEAIARQYGMTGAEMLFQADAAAGHQISPEQWASALRALTDVFPRTRHIGKRPAGTWASRRRWGW